MSWLTKWSFKNKAAVILTAFIVLVLGIASYFRLPMEFMPEADNPQVTVIVLGQGTDVGTMSNEVTVPIEKAVASVHGKSEVFSTTGDGFTKVDLFFDAGTDMKQAKVDVQDALATIQFPEGVSKPQVVQLNTNMIPIADISISFEDGITKENMELAENKIIPELKGIKGVASVAFYGKTTNEISVELDQTKLAENNIPVHSIMGALQGKNTSLAVGQGTIDGQASNIKVISILDSLEDIQNIQVAPGIKLSDVANVAPANHEGNITRINGEDALIAIITKDSNSSAVTVVEDVKEKASELTEKYDANVEVFFATADMVVHSVTSMIKEVLLGALFATIVIMLFLRNIRSTLITIVSIPLSLCFTLFLLMQSGVTLNILTIGGVAVAVGRLVDDSIVVIENIFRNMQKGKFSTKLIFESTKEVGAAITSSTLTTVAVFLPMGLATGLKELLLPFALTITYSLLSSLVVALTVVPLMSYGLLRNAKLPKHKTPTKFVSSLKWSLNHKWVVLLVAGLMFFGSIGLYFSMPKGAIDSSDAEMVMVTLDYPNDTPITEVREKATELEQFLVEQDEPKYVFTQMGNSSEMAQYGAVGSPTTVSYTIVMKEDVDAEKFIENVDAQKENYQGAQLTAGQGSLMGTSSTAITIDVLGENIENLEKAAADIEAEIKDIEGVEVVGTNQEAKKPVYSFNVNPEFANAREVSQQLGMLLNRMPIGTVNLDGINVPVFLEPVVTPKSAADLENIQLATPAGAVPINTVATLVKEEQSTQILHKGGETYIRVTATVDPKKVSIISGEITKAVNGTTPGTGMELPDGVEVVVGGAATQIASDFSELYMIMGTSIAIVYLIMVITFKTLRAPIAILFSLPLAAIGAILGLLISKIPVDPTALLGALMLIGIVVTNAIVLLDRVKQNEETMIIRDAILEAAGTRMRPILMTAIATISAMLPLLFKKAETGSLVSQSLAVVVIGGLAVSTLLTLVVIPVIYELLHFRKSKKQRRKQKAQLSSEENVAG
jgi:multidrug efflux pump subunit AcrB